jgi:hypothetical protein
LCNSSASRITRVTGENLQARDLVAEDSLTAIPEHLN